MINWIFGAIIGVVLAVILVLILHFTAFKNARLVPVYIIGIVLFAVAGGLIQYNFFKVENSESAPIPSPSEQLENLTGTIEDGWENQNGGFTFEQIQQAQNDEECPSYDDQVIKMNCYDFGAYFVFSFEDNGTYQNVLFYNSKNGLILDGLINTTATFDIKFQWYPILTWLPYYDFNTFRWNRDLTKEPYYDECKTVGANHDNMVSLSRQSAYFVDNLDTLHLMTNRDQAASYAISQAPVLTGKNATSHFIKFGDIELIGQAKDGYKKINSFYNYLYQQVKGVGYGNSKVIEANSCLCLPIPYELQKNYPISDDKKDAYNGAEYYGVYNCSIAVDLTFKQGNKQQSETQKNQQYVVEIEEDPEQKDNVAVEDVKPADVLSEVKVNFVESKGSDLSSVNLSLTPVTVTFTCKEINQSKTLVIDSFDKLNRPNYVLLSNNKTWHYLIDCKSLIFENYNGDFVLKSEKTSINFEYYYLSNEIVASVGLNPVGSFDKSQINLAAHPVNIILSNATDSYSFVFKSNNDLDSRKSQVVKMGKYNYTILSSQLVFASETGSLEITMQDKVMLFNYTLSPQETKPYTFKGTASDYTYSDDYWAHIQGFHITFDDATKAILKEASGGRSSLEIDFLFYDSNGRVRSFETSQKYLSLEDDASNVFIFDSLYGNSDLNVQISILAKGDDKNFIKYRFIVEHLDFYPKTAYDIKLNVTKNS